MKIGIVGAGPAGLLLAQHLMQQPNYEIHVFEKTPDPLQEIPPSRSYPIALQGRGMAAIRAVDPSMEEALLRSGKGKWMDSVAFYLGNKPRTMKRPAPSFMMEQGDLKREMLKHLLKGKDQSPSSLCLHFGCEIQDLFLHNQTILAKTLASNREEFAFDQLVAADGSRSTVRELLAQKDPGFEIQMKRVPGGYKKLFLETSNQAQQHVLDPNSIHGWMAGNQSFLSVPLHEDYSSGVYAFTEDPDPIADLKTPAEIMEYFQTKIPSMASFLTEKEAANLLQQSPAQLCTVRCSSLTAGNLQCETLLLGDAAHTFSASLNQGYNAALQDVQVFQQCLEGSANKWHLALLAYNAVRTVDIDAAHDLSDYALPQTNWQRVQFFGRMALRKLGSMVGLPDSLLPPPLPMDLIYDENLSYSDILRQCQGWIDQVKQSALAKELQEEEDLTQNAGKLKQMLVR